MRGSRPPGRLQLEIAVLLAVVLLLWGLYAAYLLRWSSLILAITKGAGTWVVLALLAGLPLLAWSRSRGLDARFRWWRRGVPAFALLLLSLWVVGLGFPLAEKTWKARPPVNPSTPRAWPGHSGTPVFPGAEGFGTRTPAGAGGVTLEVTSLSDSGPGTLRAALEHPAPRQVVFKVSGTVALRRELEIVHPYVSVFGQTAPGGGICLRNAGVVIMTHDVLIQHIRIRPGREGRVDADVNDAVQIFRPDPSRDTVYNIVLDHLSASWAEDEGVSILNGAHDVTISWSIISEGLDRSRHRKGRHSAGLLIGYGAYHVSVHHCLFAHNDFRNPLITHGGTHDVVNNVIYNWGILAAEVVDGRSNTFVHFSSNYFKPGPSTRPESVEIRIAEGPGLPRLFLAGNHSEMRRGSDPWSMAVRGWGDPLPLPPSMRAAGLFPAPRIAALPAEEAYPLVLSGAGATLPRRDAVDARVVEEVRLGRGGIIHDPAERGGYPDLGAATSR